VISASLFSQTIPFAMKYRLKRVNELIKRELSEIIARELTFRAALVTVQAVDVTPDLRNAHVFVSVIGAKGEQKSVIEKLEAHRSELQRLMARRVILKYTPLLRFKLDESIERGVRVVEILEQIGELPPADEPETVEDTEKEQDEH
jgi:ribosome-binding factor A